MGFLDRVRKMREARQSIKRRAERNPEMERDYRRDIMQREIKDLERNKQDYIISEKLRTMKKEETARRYAPITRMVENIKQKAETPQRRGKERRVKTTFGRSQRPNQSAFMRNIEASSGRSSFMDRVNKSPYTVGARSPFTERVKTKTRKKGRRRIVIYE